MNTAARWYQARSSSSEHPATHGQPVGDPRIRRGTFDRVTVRARTDDDQSAGRGMCAIARTTRPTLL